MPVVLLYSAGEPLAVLSKPTVLLIERKRTVGRISLPVMLRWSAECAIGRVVEAGGVVYERRKTGGRVVVTGRYCK